MNNRGELEKLIGEGKAELEGISETIAKAQNEKAMLEGDEEDHIVIKQSNERIKKLDEQLEELDKKGGVLVKRLSNWENGLDDCGSEEEEEEQKKESKDE